MSNPYRISVVTATLHRPKEVVGLLRNLSQQTLLPFELLLVDGAKEAVRGTEEAALAIASALPYRLRYIRRHGGTAIQRNVGIDKATGDFIAFIDDDIRLDPGFFEAIKEVFEKDQEGLIGGVTGYITNTYLDPNTSPRWRWYRRFHLFTTYEPGRYDFETGSPINRYLQPPHDGLREIDFMGAGCAVWRRQVFEKGLRFSEFFKDYGILEDAHLALRARREWILIENGRARCVHLKSQVARMDGRRRNRLAAVNHRYVFVDIVPKRRWKQEFRFWRVQFFDLIRFIVCALQNSGKENWLSAFGKLEGIIAALRVRSNVRTANCELDESVV